MTNPLNKTGKVQAGIYCLVCYPTGDMYIGSTLDLYSRCQQHKNCSMRSAAPMYRIIRALGIHQFQFEVMHLWNGPKSGLLEMERSLLAAYSPSLNTYVGGQRCRMSPEAYEAANPSAVTDYLNYINPDAKKKHPPYKFGVFSQLYK